MGAHRHLFDLVGSDAHEKRRGRRLSFLFYSQTFSENTTWPYRRPGRVDARAREVGVGLRHRLRHRGEHTAGIGPVRPLSMQEESYDWVNGPESAVH